jgi:2-methylcitrate dehydratase PrpD
MTTVIEKIARQMISRQSFSDLAIARAREAVIDTIGCMFAGADDQAVRSVTSAFQAEISLDRSSVIVGGGKATPSIAALINGTAAHCLDFDDNFHPARAHASAVQVPALLSVATANPDISGRQFLEAYLGGLEAQAAVGFGVNPSHYNTGWHATATVGCIGAAAGVARLLGSTQMELAQAMSIATSSACGPKGQFGTPAKPLHAGIAARNAVEASLLARAGMVGRLDILERSQGFIELFGGDAASGWNGLTFDDRHVIETRGLVTKLHPCCASTHRAIDALLDLQAEHGFTNAQIEGIETKVGISAAKNLAYPEPTDEMQARFSMQYCLATALVHGRLRLRDFTAAAIKRADIRALMGKVGMSAHSVEEERGVERLPHRVTVILKDGRRLSQERLHARGAIECPLSEQDRRDKFEDCLAWARERNGAPDFDALQDLDRAPSLAAYFAAGA